MCVEYRAGKVCCQRRLNSALLGEQEQLTAVFFRFQDHILDWFCVLASGESLTVFAESSSRLR